MGGSGSGRTPSPSSKPTTDGRISLTVARVTNALGWAEIGDEVPVEWMRQPLEGLFSRRPSGPKVLRLRVWLTKTDEGCTIEFALKDGTEQVQDIRFDYTRQHLGGWRTWFLCPGQDGKGCGRRVGKLWLGREFACRACHGLAYGSQFEDPIGRAHRRSSVTRQRLGAPSWEAQFMGPVPARPSRMRFRTYLGRRLKIAEADRMLWDLVVRHTGYASTDDLSKALNGDPDAPEPSMAIRWSKG